MTKIFKYSILKYRPSYLLGEQVNIGLLFFFLEDNKVSFVYPSKLRRLTQFYPKANLRNVKRYLYLFEQKANKLDIPFGQSDFSHFVEVNFLPKDASNFYFTTTKEGIYKNPSSIIEHYNSLYFSSYEGKKHIDKKDESYIKGAFNSKLEKAIKGDKEKLALFKHSPTIKNKISNTNFDYGWQNGTTNLVKFLSFDLADKGHLQDKSFRWYGELSQLAEQAKSQNLKFDLILSKPEKKDLFSSYDKVLQVLEDIKADKEIIEEGKGLDDYIYKAVDSVKPFTNRKLLEKIKK